MTTQGKYMTKGRPWAVGGSYWPETLLRNHTHHMLQQLAVCAFPWIKTEGMALLTSIYCKHSVNTKLRYSGWRKLCNLG
jgi:hypothetical protein